MARLAWILLLCSQCLLAQTLVVAVPSDVLGDYHRWLRGRDPLNVIDYAAPGVRRDVVEVALFSQALAMGCGGPDVEWLPVDSYPRTLSLLGSGRIDAAATSVWRRDGEREGVALSAAVIGDGEFVASLYRLASKPIQVQTEKDLAHYSVVSSRHWSRDWKVLRQLPFAQCYNVNDWPTMVRWVASGKADMLMAPMVASDPPVMLVEDVALVPVRGVRIALPGSRHFAVRNEPWQDTTLDQCFAEGLQQLRDQGRIDQAYRQSGFWRADFMHWPLLNGVPGKGAQ